MEQHWLERFKMWICKQIGHKTSVEKSWYFNTVHCHCERCGMIVSKEIYNKDNL